jgi:ketosteroid isomerase-like protein
MKGVLSMSEQENTKIVQEAYAAFLKGDIQGVLALVTDDVEWVIPGPVGMLPTAGTYRGKDGVVKFFSILDESEQIEVFEPKEFIAQGDKVVATVNFRSRPKATNIPVEDELVHIFTLRDGKIARFREYFDTVRAVEAHTAANIRATAAS